MTRNRSSRGLARTMRNTMISNKNETAANRSQILVKSWMSELHEERFLVLRLITVESANKSSDPRTSPAYGVPVVDMSISRS